MFLFIMKLEGEEAMGKRRSLGNYISARRRDMKLTQEELAEEIGVSKSAIAKWETDGGLPDRDNLKRLSETMKTTVDELHRIIENSEAKAPNVEINITPEIIAALEAHGYKVIRPGEDQEK